MLLCRALSSWVPALPYLVIEVLHDDEVLSGLSVASNGTAHAERVPQLRKVYLIEPSARQVVRVTCLRKVSQRSPLVFCWFLHHVFFSGCRPWCFCTTSVCWSMSDSKLGSVHSFGWTLAAHRSQLTAFPSTSTWRETAPYGAPATCLLSHTPNLAVITFCSMQGCGLLLKRINVAFLVTPQRSPLKVCTRYEICAFRLDERNPRLCRYLSVGSGDFTPLPEV